MSDELTEDENQLLWKYATEDVTTEELAEIEELQTTNPAFAQELQELEAQKREEAERHQKAESKGGSGMVLVIVIALAGAATWYFFF